MKKFLYIFTSLILCLGISSCWEENIPELGALRHQVQDFVAIPGDEEVVLSWTMPEEWNPSDFIITYNDTESSLVTIYTNGGRIYTVTNLENEYEYTFGVQAVYGEDISSKVTAVCKPTTSRFAVSDLIADTGDCFVELFWEQPSSLLQSYTIQYYMEGDENNVKEVTVDNDSTSYKFENLTNDKNYTFIITVNYQNGSSEETIIKAMPALAIPYFVSATSVAQGWPVTFQFNRDRFPSATDVKWTFPDDATPVAGDEVTRGIYALGKQNVILTADVNGVAKEWKIEINLREWVVMSSNLERSGSSYNGFKGSYPVFSPDGKTVYSLTFNKITVLYAYDIESGEEKWRHVPETASGSYNPLTVNPVTGDIYFGTTTAGQFYCVGADGKHKWTFTEAGSMQSTAPAVSADGSTVFIIDASGNTFSLNAATGTKNWGKALGSKGGSLLINGNDLIVAIQNTTKTIQFLNTADGEEITTLDCSKNATDIAGIAVSDDKKQAYVPLLGGGLVSIDLATRTVIKENLFAENNVYAPVVSSNGYVVAGSKDGSVYALKSDLSEVVWKYTHTGTATNNVFNYSHMCADTEGRVYVTTGQTEPGTTLVMNALTGEIIQSFTYQSDATKQMGGNNYNSGVIYGSSIGAGSVDGCMYGKYVGGTRKFWGGPGGDVCGSGCLQSPLLN